MSATVENKDQSLSSGQDAFEKVDEGKVFVLLADKHYAYLA